MSVEYSKNRVFLMCDECEDEQTDMYRNDDFKDMIANAKADNWLITRDEDDEGWTHVCPACVKLLPKVTSR